MKNLFPFLFIMLLANLCGAQELTGNPVKITNGWDNVLMSTYNGKDYHLVGTYQGWDPDAIFIGGYNYFNNSSIATKKIHIGNPHFGIGFITVNLESNNIGIGTTNPQSKLSIVKGTNGISMDPSAAPYFGCLAFNREVLNGAIFNPAANAFQINNGPDANLHLQVYNGNGQHVATDALVVSGTTGFIGLGTANPTEQLSVKGKIRAQEIKVELTGWSDFVFAKDYKLRSLPDLENYIKTNNHLPEIPSEKQVVEEGVSLGEMNKKLLQKIEELTLYMIEMKKENQKHQAQILNLEQEVKNLKTK